MERTLKCVRMEKNQFEKIFRKKTRDDRSIEYSVFCPYESHTALQSDEERAGVEE